MRLMDADELLKEDFTEIFVDPTDQPIFEWIISKTPTIDAVPVVRCKDCKRRIETMKPEYEKGGGICGRMYDTGEIEGYLCRVSADDFCSYGERKDGDV